MQQKIEELVSRFKQDIEKAADSQAVENIRIAYLDVYKRQANKNPGKQIIMPKNGKIIFPESDTNDRANPSTAGILKRTFPATCPSV